MKEKKKIITLEFNTKGEKKLKDNISVLDKATSTSAILSSNLAKTFANFQDFSDIIGTNTDYMAEAIAKIIPEVNTASEKINTLAEMYLEKSLKKQIDNIKYISEKKYDTNYKYTEQSKSVYIAYYDFQEKLYSADAEKLKKILEEKERYLKEYNKQQTSLQENIAADDQIKSDDLRKSLQHKNDLKKEAQNSDLIQTLVYIKEEEKLQTERNTRITALTTSAIERQTEAGRTFNFIKLKETKENYKAIKELRLQNIEAAKEEYKRIAEYHDKLIASYKKGSLGEAQAMENKKNALHKINTQIIADQQAVNGSTEEMGKAYQLFFDEVAKKITDFHTKWQGVYSAAGSVLKDFLTIQITDLKEDQTNVQKIIEERTTAYQQQADKVKSLYEEMQKASGAHATTLQENYARESATAEELLQQKKDAEKEKEEIEKQIKRKEKQQKKIELVQTLASAVANQSAAIIKAWGMGPIIGPIMAAITAAATAIQIANIKRQWDKLEDGGLLRGKRHTQGGMRIEGSNIEVEGDEFVVNRISTRKNLGLVDYINRERRELTAEDLTGYFSRSRGQNFPRIESKRIYESGGQLTNLEVVDSVTAPEINKILDAISNIDFRPVVSVTDIADAQRTMVSVERTVNS